MPDIYFSCDGGGNQGGAAFLHFSFPNSSLGMPIAKLRLVWRRTKQVYFYVYMP
jgi:hypothetical protein